MIWSSRSSRSLKFRVNDKMTLTDQQQWTHNYNNVHTTCRMKLIPNTGNFCFDFQFQQWCNTSLPNASFFICNCTLLYVQSVVPDNTVQYSVKLARRWNETRPTDVHTSSRVSKVYIGWQWRNFFISYLLPVVFPPCCRSSSAKCFLLGHHFLCKIALIRTFS